MTSLCARSPQIHVNLSSAEISKIENDLRSDFGPFVIPPERAEEIKQMLALADKDIEDHDTEIARLHDQILVIEEQKQQLKAQRARLCSLLSLIRKLPNEVLLCILQHVCDSNNLYGYAPKSSYTSPCITYLPAMVVSSVCSRWRKLALSSPSLWANLTVEIHNLDGKLDEFRFMVALYLERSAEWPLRLSLSIECYVPKEELPLPFLDLLLQHAHRWKTFKFWGEESLTLYQLPSQLHFPLLLDLDITIDDLVPDNGDLELFEHTPRLHTLATIDELPPRVSFNELNALYISMDVDSVSPTELADILHRYPSLKSLSLELYGEADIMPQGKWHNITFLAVEESFTESRLDMVFSSLQFPSLNELVVNGGHVRRTYTTDSLISFITTSSCMVTTFTLCGLYVSDVNLCAALRVMPSISYLEIDDSNSRYAPDSLQSPITSHLMSSLRDQSTSIPLAPKLHCLRLLSKRQVPFDDLTFISMVESRWFKPGSDLSASMLSIGKACIRSVVLTFSWREVDAEVYQPLRNLDAEGLRVVVAGTNGVQV